MSEEDKKNRKRLDYHIAFDNDHGRAVLDDLAEFTRCDEAEYCADARKDAYLQGRRSVLLHIRELLKGT